MEELIKYIKLELEKVDLKTSIEELTIKRDDLYKKLSFLITIYGREEDVKKGILDNLLQYQYGVLKEDDFINKMFECTGNTYDPVSMTITPIYNYNYNYDYNFSHKSASTKKVIDISADIILDLIEKYEKIKVDFENLNNEIIELNNLNLENTNYTKIINDLKNNDNIKVYLDSINEKIMKTGNEFIDIDKNITANTGDLDITKEQVVTAATYYKATGTKIKYGDLSNGFNMSEVKKDDIGNYLNGNGWKKDGDFYVSKDGNYKYNFVNGKVYADSKSIRCGFYKTGNTNLGTINNTITLLSGSGSSKDFNIESMKLSNGSLVVVPEYTSLGGITTRDHNKQIVACTKVGDFLSSSSNTDDIYNSLIGYSLGSQAGTYAIANNPGVYNTFVSVNGNTKSYNNGGYDFIGGKYDSFKGVNVIYIQSKNNDTCKLIKGNVEAATEIAAHGGNVLLLTNGEIPEGWNLPFEIFTDDKFINHKDGNVAIVNILTSLSSTK